VRGEVRLFVVVPGSTGGVGVGSGGGDLVRERVRAAMGPSSLVCWA
jgi:hypothetical protein